TVFMGAFLDEMARIANENIERSFALFGRVPGANIAPIESRRAYQSIAHINGKQQYLSGDAATLTAQIESLKQTVALLRDQLADMHEQRDKWQRRSERISLTASY